MSRIHPAGLRGSPTLRLASAWLGGVASFSCTLLMDPGREQCSTTRDCVARGAAFAQSVCTDSLCQEAVVDPWRCLDDPMPVAPTTATVHASIRVCDSLRGCSLVLRGLTAKLCAKLDAGCTNPIRADVPNINGVFEFDAPTGLSGFDGYLQISAPPEPCTDRDVFGGASDTVCALLPGCDPAAPDERCAIPPYSPTLQFFNPPIVADAELPTLQIVSTASSLGIAQAAGVVYDPAQGSLLVTAQDCDGAGAAGLTFSIDDHPSNTGQSLYLENNIPTPARRQTDATGIGLFIGLPEGFFNVVARDGKGTRVGSVGVYVAASSNSYTNLAP